jgi:putative sigma-54 modulation protein
MSIKVKAVHFKADQKLIEFAEKKVSKLIEKSDSIISADVTFIFEKSKKVDNKVVEITMKVSGPDLFSKKESKSFEESIDLAVEALRKQVEKIKEKK